MKKDAMNNKRNLIMVLPFIAGLGIAGCGGHPSSSSSSSTGSSSSSTSNTAVVLDDAKLRALALALAQDVGISPDKAVADAHAMCRRIDEGDSMIDVISQFDGDAFYHGIIMAMAFGTARAGLC